MSLNDQFARGDRMLLPEYLAGVEDRDGFSRWVDFDVYHRTGCHDCSEQVARERFQRSRRQSVRPFGKPRSLVARPGVPARYVLCSEDRILNNRFWRAAARARVGGEPVDIPGSHSPMASQSELLAQLLTAGS